MTGWGSIRHISNHPNVPQRSRGDKGALRRTIRLKKHPGVVGQSMTVICHSLERLRPEGRIYWFNYTSPDIGTA